MKEKSLTTSNLIAAILAGVQLLVSMGTLKLQDWILQDWSMTDIAGLDIEGLDIDGLHNGGPDIDGLDIAGLVNDGRLWTIDYNILTE